MTPLTRSDSRADHLCNYSNNNGGESSALTRTENTNWICAGSWSWSNCQALKVMRLLQPHRPVKSGASLGNGCYKSLGGGISILFKTYFWGKKKKMSTWSFSDKYNSKQSKQIHPKFSGWAAAHPITFCGCGISKSEYAFPLWHTWDILVAINKMAVLQWEPSKEKVSN